MPGKFINEITGDTPAKDDLAVFFDKSKNSTAQATIAEIVNAGLDLAAGAKGQVPTIDVKVDAATSSLVNILTWGAGGGVDFKGTPTRPPTGTDEILTNDPANGLIGKTTLQQLVVAGGATILQPGTAVNTALVWNDTAGKWEPARAVSEAKNINGGATGELPFQLNTHVTAWIPLGNAGQVLTIGDIGTAGNSFIAPMWNDPVKELPTFTIADKGKQLTVKADGKATEWVNPELPIITLGNQVLATKSDKSGVEWAPVAKELPDFALMPVGSRLATNSTKTGVEWVNPPAELPGKLGSAGQILVVNATATNPEWQYGLQMPAAAPGTSLTIRAASANQLGKGGNLILQAGSQSTSGGDGVVTIQQPTGGAGTATVFAVKNASGGTIFSQAGNGDMVVGNGGQSVNNGINIFHSLYPSVTFSNNSTTASTGANIALSSGDKVFRISTFNLSGYSVVLDAANQARGQCALSSTGLLVAQYAAGNDEYAGSAVWVQAFSASKSAVVIDGVFNQTSDLLVLRKKNSATPNDVSILCSFSREGAFKPAHLADTAAPNGSLYYSSTAGKLVFKDPSGVVNNLY